MVYALGFFARPLGGIIFGHYGDKVGRKQMLVISLLMMGAGTFAIGLLPTYGQVGILAPILLIVCRLLQGFAVGGEWGGAVLMAAEHGDASRRGFWTSFVQAGVPAGNLVAAAVLWVLAFTLSDDQFQSWGWRVAFLLSAVLVGVGMWVRLTLEESPVFAAARDELAEKTDTHMPIIQVVKQYPREILIAMGMRTAENISYYLFTVISLTFLADYMGEDKQVGINGVLIGSAIQVVLVPLIGVLSDRVGRRPLYLIGAVGVGVWGFIFFGLLEDGSGIAVATAVTVGLVFHSLMYAPQAAFFAELFGTSVRYSGASIGYQLASVFAGALAPIIALALLGDVSSPNTTAVGIYLAVASAITVVAVLCSIETRGSSLDHDRVAGQTDVDTSATRPS
jgi:MFS family permease